MKGARGGWVGDNLKLTNARHACSKNKKVAILSHTHPIKSCLEGAMSFKHFMHRGEVMIVYGEYTGDKVSSDI